MSLELPQLNFGALPISVDRGVGWAEARNAGPVLFGDGWYYLTRREDVTAALRDPAVFSSKTGFEMGSPVPLVPLAFDPPEHTRFRKILHPFFSAQALATLLPSLRSQAGAMIEAIAERDECEVMAELATPFPSQVFLTLFGLPLDDRDELIRWTAAIIELSLAEDPAEVDLTPAAELYTYLTDAVDKHRRDPGDGVLSLVLAGDDPLTDAEAVGLSFVFVLAGLDTVKSAIGATILELARRPDVRSELREKPQLVPAFVEEMIRIEPAVPVIARTTTRPVTIGGIRLPEGAQVRLCIGAINRDGSDGNSGDDLVMDGKLHKHWGFGGGPHRCLGSHLARMELTVVVNEWLRRIPEFELAPGYRPEIPWPAATCSLPTLPLRITR